MKRRILASLILVSGCTTTPNVSPPPLSVPDSLSQQDVEEAIIMCFKAPEANDVSRGMHMAGEFIYRDFGSDFIKKYWHYEGRENEIIQAGFTNRKYYMHVDIDYSDEKVAFSITDSRNLRQSEKRIHKSAMKWLGRLESDVRMCLGEYDRFKYQQSVRKQSSNDKKT